MPFNMAGAQAGGSFCCFCGRPLLIKPIIVSACFSRIGPTRGWIRSITYPQKLRFHRADLSFSRTITSCDDGARLFSENVPVCRPTWDPNTVSIVCGSIPRDHPKCRRCWSLNAGMYASNFAQKVRLSFSLGFCFGQANAPDPQTVPFKPRDNSRPGPSSF